jgi:multidrug efflux pump subunit AcrA (membrane-fusion protein)
MPIGTDEWIRGTTDRAEQSTDGYTKEKLLEYLELNAEEAYTAAELATVYAQRVAGEGVPGRNPGGVRIADYPSEPGVLGHLLGTIGEVVFARSGRIEAALEDLAAEGRIEARTIETTNGEQTYYRASTGETSDST